jgi:hypothetical protein
MHDDFIAEIAKNAQGSDEFIFKHKEKFGKEVFETKQKVDVNGIEDEEVSLEKVLRGFFRFLSECGWDAEFVLYKTMEIVSEAEEALNSINMEENPLTKDNPEFKMFLMKLGEGEPQFLKELYELHSGFQSKN